MGKVKYAPAGDQGIVINFGGEISEEINRQIYGAVKQIDCARIKGVIEVIPSYTSLLVLYDRETISYGRLLKQLGKLVERPAHAGAVKGRIHHIPVCYEPEFAPDLQEVAEYCGLSPEEIVDIHTGTDYLIYMLGFLPGFAYLGGMDSRIECPRLTTPRTKIPAGGVGIGGKQTGIYPLESPGGWRIIGQTPVRVYDPDRDPSILYAMGERIRFEKITAEEYKEVEALVQSGDYQHRITEVDL